ncbi:PPC domain-containing protein [Micromonospora sp. NPDC049559]|uniref:PPC domain-containing protein n=1 Tax=Micromonospora sp. NPDC049559 TaxID=3155923 RepID=UPI0034284F94
MRRTFALLAAGVLTAASLAPTGASAQPGDTSARADGRSAATARATALPNRTPAADKRSGKPPAGPNPYLALLPDPSRADYAGWQRWLAAKGDERAARQTAQRGAAPAPLTVTEAEPAGTYGVNDTPATAQRVDRFGTGGRGNPRARVVGTLSPERVPVTEIPATAEDDGSIPLARDTGVGSTVPGIATSAEIGDGPHGSAGSGSGDFDVYRITGTAGKTLTVDVDTPPDTLDSFVVLYDAAGEVVAYNDDSPTGLDSLLTHRFAATGTYYVLVAGFLAVPDDPFDSGSGTGAGSEGPYDVKITTGQADVDVFAVRLAKGDVLGASIAGSGGWISVRDPRGREVHGSAQDASGIYPANTPLPGGGNAVTEHVAEQDGWHYVEVTTGDGAYDITVEAHRPGLEGQRSRQTLFLDFDGARLNTAIFGGPGVRTLSPLRSFLPRWGLTPADENALIDAIVAEVRENLERDLARSGLNSRFELRILNSRDHADPFGQPDVSRVIVGGSIDESGIPTIGIAQSIDPGNFGTEESALVLLDVLSEPAGEEASVNTYLTPASNRIAFIGQAVGNVTSHEAGHFFGDWHVDQFNDTANLMDQGGNPALMFGVGPDGVGGTADDPDVDFGEDVFNPNEGFTGIEDTLSRPAFGLTR